ncbi:MAG: YaiI/YqxD family protein [Candidatus Hydrogenedentes bacterium]|nr:YaiI/YqxD family protein [Candidatus Hydrogenedentota bacterium]
MTTIFVDADACPVKNEVYRVAERLKLNVKVVANASLYVPEADWIELIVVGNAIDAADDWIAEHSGPNDIVIADDIPLAARCIRNGSRVLSPKGNEFTQEAIGNALAKREILSQLRENGLVKGGPAPFQSKDRSQFLQRLDTIARACLSLRA